MERIRDFHDYVLYKFILHYIYITQIMQNSDRYAEQKHTVRNAISFAKLWMG